MQFVNHQFAGIRATKAGILPVVGSLIGLQHRNHSARFFGGIGFQIGIGGGWDVLIVPGIQYFMAERIGHTQIAVNQKLVSILLTGCQIVDLQPKAFAIRCLLHIVLQAQPPVVEVADNKSK